MLLLRRKGKKIPSFRKITKKPFIPNIISIIRIIILVTKTRNKKNTLRTTLLK